MRFFIVYLVELLLTITLLKEQEEGRWQSENLEVLPEEIFKNEVLWVDAQDPTESDMEELKNYFSIDEHNLQELTQEGVRSRIDEHEDRVFCLLNFPNRESFVSDGKMERLAMLICSRWIITMHKGYSELTCAVYKKISAHGYFSLSLVPSTDIMLYIFLDLVTSEYYPVSDLVFEKIEALSREALGFFREGSSLAGSGFGMQIVSVRERLVALRQSLSPFRDIMGRITRGEFALVQGVHLSRFGDLYDRTIQLVEVVDAHREEMSNIRDILVNAQTVTTNNIIRVLTIISAIFLPLTLIAGIYGTNFKTGFLPEANNPYGFYIMIVIMVTVALALTLIFKRRGWLRSST
ncbi:MAG: magnesium transporter CorA family protein [Candidatus Bathyarchaeia archaeon]